MKKILNIILSLILLALGVYYFRANLAQVPVFKGALTTVGFIDAPCTRPIQYTLGKFDTQFNISQDYFLSALADAEMVWEGPTKKNLFEYSSTSTSSDTVKVNLVYDYRQEATTELNSLGITVDNGKSSYDALKARFEELKIQINTAEANHEKPSKINLMINEANTLVAQINQIAGKLNLAVETYNTTNTARGESFEEGVYSETGTDKEIDIYEFSDRAKLVRVLAHELGHALGLEHVDDPKAIMYKFNQGTNDTLTQADLDELKIVCKIK